MWETNTAIPSVCSEAHVGSDLPAILYVIKVKSRGGLFAETWHTTSQLSTRLICCLTTGSKGTLWSTLNLSSTTTLVLPATDQSVRFLLETPYRYV